VKRRKGGYENEDAKTDEDLLSLLWEAYNARSGKGEKGESFFLEVDSKAEET
jgi:hypothetical protein